MDLLAHDIPLFGPIPVRLERIVRVVARRIRPNGLDRAERDDRPRLRNLRLARRVVDGRGADRRPKLFAVVRRPEVDVDVPSPEEPVLLDLLLENVGEVVLVLDRVRQLLDLLRLVRVADALELDPVPGHVGRERLRAAAVFGPLGEFGEVRVAEEHEPLGDERREHARGPFARKVEPRLVVRHERFGRRDPRRMLRGREDRRAIWRALLRLVGARPNLDGFGDPQPLLRLLPSLLLHDAFSAAALRAAA